ncbi:AAA family ATPase [Amycolatopsis australiensis]|uniref:Regulatory protein, luxR family n=1 Tax=Amycolatopsis australiensis TaxID=546364 RepID=A0A1K1RVQ7_9PSEU|nr:LuxR family transcriptional regulator [Amycolatopsis australiensis]SFW75847.1 regulatory protein, luxR family [Amycolatopsis australiensis]
MGSPDREDGQVIATRTAPGAAGLPHQRGVPLPALAERDEECALLTGMLHDLPEGHSAVVTVTGAPGCGRSALLAAVAAAARAARLRVAHVPCCPSDPAEPFTVLQQVFTGLGVALPPEATGPVPPDERVLGALCRDLHTALDTRPLVLVVDDLHWADTPSRAWLHELAGRQAGAPVLLVVSQVSGLDTWRPPATAAAHAIRLRPLGDAAVAGLVREQLGAEAGERLVGHAVRGSGGNPAVLAEALQRLRLEPGGPELFPRIASERLLRLLDGLPAELTAVLRALAVCPAGFGPALLAELAGCPPERLGDALARLRALGLADGFGGLTEPDVGQRVLGGMSEVDRDAFFARAAKLGYDHGVANAAVAAILRRTRVVGEPWAVEVLVAAARIGRGEEVTALLKRALQEPLDPARRAAVLLDLGAAELLVDPDAGDRHLAQVLSEVDGGGLGEHRLAAADLLVARGGLPGRTLVAAFRRPDVSAAERGALLGLYWLADGDPHDRSEVGGYGMPPLPERPADPAQAAVAAVLLARRGLRPARVRGLARAALAQPVAEACSLTMRAAAVRALTLTGDLAEADAHGEDVLARARRQGFRMLIARALAERAERHLAAGRLTAAAADLADAHELVPPRHWHPMLRARVIGTEAMVHVAAGRADLARRALDRDATEPGRGLGGAFLLYAQGLVLLEEGRREAALARLRECGRRLSARGWANPELLPWRSAAAKCLVAAGERDDARRLLAEELAAAKEWGTRSAVGGAHLAAALALGPGDPGHAEHLKQAVELLRGTGSDLRYATALAESAGVGDHLAEAAALAARHGWRRVRTRLDELTGRPAEDPRHGLSEAQRRVANLAAAGVSNADIAAALEVTRRTVELHLTNVYRKLGIDGRRQLAGALAAREGSLSGEEVRP